MTKRRLQIIDQLAKLDRRIVVLLCSRLIEVKEGEMFNWDELHKKLKTIEVDYEKEIKKKSA